MTGERKKTSFPPRSRTVFPLDGAVSLTVSVGASPDVMSWWWTEGIDRGSFRHNHQIIVVVIGVRVGSSSSSSPWSDATRSVGSGMGGRRIFGIANDDKRRRRSVCLSSS